MLRYAETTLAAMGSFEFKYLTPCKYLLHGREVAEKEPGDKQVRPVVWNAVERGKLRRKVEAAENGIELKLCER